MKSIRVQVAGYRGDDAGVALDVPSLGIDALPSNEPSQARQAHADLRIARQSERNPQMEIWIRPVLSSIVCVDTYG